MTGQENFNLCRRHARSLPRHIPGFDVGVEGYSTTYNHPWNCLPRKLAWGLWRSFVPFWSGAVVVSQHGIIGREAEVTEMVVLGDLSEGKAELISTCPFRKLHTSVSILMQDVLL